MVDVSAKAVTTRTAEAQALVHMKPAVVRAIRRLKNPKGKGRTADTASGKAKANGRMLRVRGDEIHIVSRAITIFAGGVSCPPAPCFQFLLQQPFAGGVLRDDGKTSLQWWGLVERQGKLIVGQVIFIPVFFYGLDKGLRKKFPVGDGKAAQKWPRNDSETLAIFRCGAVGPADWIA